MMRTIPQKSLGVAAARVLGMITLSCAAIGLANAQVLPGSSGMTRTDAGPASPALAPASKRELDVTASIELERILHIRPSGNVYHGSGEIAVWSPDRRYFAVITRRGDVASDELIERVIVWDGSAVTAAVETGGPPPAPKTTFVNRFRVDHHAITSLRWGGPGELTFIAPDPQGIMQAMALNVELGSSRQLTRARGDVVAFVRNQERSLYWIREERTEAPALEGDEVSLFFDQVKRDWDFRPLGLYTEKAGVPGSVQVTGVTYPNEAFYYTGLWISPDGSSAVVLSRVNDVPTSWSTFPTSAPWVSYVASSAPGGNGRNLQYVYLDFATGTARPLYDAPAAIHSYNGTPQAAFWSKDGRRLILTNTHLPPSATPNGQSPNLLPVTAEVEIRSGQVTPIFTERLQRVEAPGDGYLGKERDEVQSFDWDPAAEVLTVLRANDKGRAYQVAYRRGVSGNWTAKPRRDVTQKSDSATIERVEKYDVPPRLVAKLGSRELTLLDPNDGMRGFKLGEARKFQWRDENGVEWKGGLILPVGYVPGKRYPTIVQTHGYKEGEYLIDGPSGGTSAFAAQAFANAGFLVLQAPDIGALITNDETEGKRVAAGFRAAVQELVSQGMSDPARVGLVGWSRTGFHTIAALAEDPKLYAAALLSDAIQYSYLSLLNQVPYRSMNTITRMTGPIPKEGSLGPWFDRQPLYRLPLDVPLKIEAMRPLAGVWETYALLRYRGAPVDIAHYPGAPHVLLRPSQRLASQGGAVDWFRFWLLGQEDAQPRHRARYVRWRQIRASLCEKSPRHVACAPMEGLAK
jgi:dipeptidyl aminopeptidase/acylaminoacyl peptidase